MSSTNVSRWGNSLAIRIPHSVAKRARLAEGDSVVLDLSADGSIVLRPNRRKYDLQDLVGKITRKNRHSEVGWGPPAGKETW